MRARNINHDQVRACRARRLRTAAIAVRVGLRWQSKRPIDFITH
ncbi:hypothetical protein J2R80_006669 [Bradyrhizobium sp. USDA 4541]|nr:hypothetical protein [Bradyrhizobium sp. USDA 4541]